MNKKDLVSRVSEILRENDLRKPVKIKKHKFRIIDEEGNTADFTVKRADKQVIYTVDDINKIIDACIDAILESIRRVRKLTSAVSARSDYITGLPVERSSQEQKTGMTSMRTIFRNFLVVTI